MKLEKFHLNGRLHSSPNIVTIFSVPLKPTYNLDAGTETPQESCSAPRVPLTSQEAAAVSSTGGSIRRTSPIQQPNNHLLPKPGGGWNPGGGAPGGIPGGGMPGKPGGGGTPGGGCPPVPGAPGGGRANPGGAP